MKSIMRSSIRKIVLVAFLLAACQPTVQIENTPTSVVLLSTPTATATVTLTETSKPTDTNLPIATATAVRGLRVIDLPEWVRNPENRIFLLPDLVDTSTRPSKFMLINPKDGEQVMVELRLESYFQYWRDSDHAVFLQDGWCDEEGGPKYVAELDISKGTIWEGRVEQYSEPVKGCYYFLDNEEDNVSFNRDLPEITVSVVDPATGQTVLLTNPNDGVNDISYALSPNRDYLAIVQAGADYQPSELWRPEYGKQISVYSLPGREHLLTFDESLDISTRVTFINNESLVYVRENTPCLIMLQSMEKKCIHTISEQFPETTVLVEGQLSNSKELSFLYFHEGHGGFCLYDLLSGDLDCPTDHFTSMEEQTVINYSISPDEKYLLFQYDSKGCPLPWCDNFRGPQWAVTDLEGNKLFELGAADIVQFMPFQPNPWRPFDE